MQALESLGFTGLEAEVYTFMLREPAVTGYRVAQALGKPTANTYKAIESLERKGAVIVDDGENRVFRAIPVAELLNELGRRFDENRRRAADVLAGLGKETTDDRLYELRRRGQVLERCRAMLDRCRHVAVADLAPVVLVALCDSLERAAARGVEVVIKTYEPFDVPGARVVVRPRGHEVIGAVPGQFLSLNIDGAEHLLALLRSQDDAVHQAIWTGSAIVSFLLYNGLVNEVSQVAVMCELDKSTTVDALREVFSSLRHLHPFSSKGPPYQNLLSRLGLSQAELASVDSAAGAP